MFSAEADAVSESRSWPNLAFIVGGLLMVPMWVRFTTLHGPTSFNEDGQWLGQGAIFWGGMMGFASLLIVIGVVGHRVLLEAGGRSARIGFWLALVGLGIPALADIAFRGLVMGLLLSAAFLMNLVPLETLDRFHDAQRRERSTRPRRGA